MDREQEIHTLRQQLGVINEKIQEELGKIEVVKANLRKAYRRADKEKYERERDGIKENLEAYRKELDEIEGKLAELEAGTAA